MPSQRHGSDSILDSGFHDGLITEFKNRKSSSKDGTGFYSIVHGTANNSSSAIPEKVQSIPTWNTYSGDSDYEKGGDLKSLSTESTSFSTSSYSSQPHTQLEKDLPQHNSNKTIEIYPGFTLPFLGLENINQAIDTGDFELTTCASCMMSLNYSTKGSFLLCPFCKSVIPVVTTTQRDQSFDQECVVLGFITGDANQTRQ
jgi:predicted RNA-binding Zn-ribbon protein involved in translation (DUF1610 family)